MTRSPSIVVKTLLTLAVAGSMAALLAQPAAAQSATSLDCKGCIKSKQVKNGKLKGKDLKDSTVTGSKIAPNAVDSSKILDGTLQGTDIAGESVSADNLSNESGVDFAVEPDLAFTTTDEIILSVSVTAPSDGFVTVIAAGSFVRLGTDGRVGCSVTTDSVVDITNDVTADLTVTTTRIPFTALETFAQNGNTTVIYNLVCNAQTATSATADDVDMAAMFFSTQY